MSFLITSVLNCASDRLAISSSLSCIFLWNFDVFFHLGHFFGSSYVRYKGQSLSCSPGRGNPCGCVVTLYVGEGPRGNNATCSALGRLSVTSPSTHKQSGLFWCWFLGGWFVYILGPCGSLQQTLLWVWECLLPMPQHPPVFSIRGLRVYFPMQEPWVVWSVLLPSSSSRFICMRTWDCPLHQLLCHWVCQLPSRLPQSASCSLATSPLHPAARLRPSYQFVWMCLL